MWAYVLLQDPQWDKFLAYAVRLFRPLALLKRKRIDEGSQTTQMINQMYGPWLKLVMWDDGKLAADVKSLAKYDYCKKMLDKAATTQCQCLFVPVQ